MSHVDVSRRNFFLGTLVTVGAGLAGYTVASNSSAARAKDATTAANDYGYSAPPARRQIATVGEVPANGALIVSDAGIVLVRDDASGVRGYTATCTHQGCAVTDVRDGQIICPCHGSTFDIRTGAVTGGPAKRPLPPIAVTVEGEAVYAGGSS